VEKSIPIIPGLGPSPCTKRMLATSPMAQSTVCAPNNIQKRKTREINILHIKNKRRVRDAYVESTFS